MGGVLLCIGMWLSGFGCVICRFGLMLSECLFVMVSCGFLLVFLLVLIWCLFWWKMILVLVLCVGWCSSWWCISVGMWGSCSIWCWWSRVVVLGVLVSWLVGCVCAWLS